MSRSVSHTAAPALARRLRRAVVAGVAIAALLAPAAAQAWKPSTHVYLAEQALQDALDDGKVRIMEVDPRTGATLGVLGDFEVDPEILAALRAAPDRYRAGVIGPDGFPDIMTGQQIIHPRVARDEAGDLAGTDAWLSHLWGAAYGRPSAPEVRAFVAGYLAHAAGDAFAHTYVNHYSGGDFTLSPAENALKHVVLESYLGKRTPQGADGLPMSIDGVEAFIHAEMTFAAPGSALEQRLLLAPDGGAAALPLIYSGLRNRLQTDIETYYREKADRTGAARVAYMAANAARITYYEHWVEDIDEGLKAWPRTSARIARALLYSPDGMDTDAAKAVMNKYVRDHLISMSGAPDVTGPLVYAPSDFAKAVLPEALRESLARIIDAPLEALIRAATGRSMAEWKDLVKNPETHFDAVLDNTAGAVAPGQATAVTLAAFNRDQLQVDDAGYARPELRWSAETFAPAFNSVQLTKLSLLGERGAAELDAALASRGAGPVAHRPYRNLMLGWVRSMDAGGEWRARPDGAGGADFARDEGTFLRLFKPHPGM